MSKEEEFEKLRTRVLEQYGEVKVTMLEFILTHAAKAEGRPAPTDDELRVIHLCNWLNEQVEKQMNHLSSLCEEPVWDVSKLDDEDKQRLTDHFDFERGDEKIAARAKLVKLHQPDPEGLTDEEYEEWLLSRPRAVFVPCLDITVREAFDYLDYWRQEAEKNAAVRGFVSEWKGYQEIAELVGDKPPQTVGEYWDYLQKLRTEEDEV